MQQLRGILASNAALVGSLKQVAAASQAGPEVSGGASPHRLPREWTESPEDQLWQ